MMQTAKDKSIRSWLCVCILHVWCSWTIWPQIAHRPSIGFSHIWSFGQACNWWPHVWFLLMQSLEFGLVGMDFHALTHG